MTRLALCLLLLATLAGCIEQPGHLEVKEDPARRIALLSVCEGDDKPAKYPTLFYKADLMLVTKSDLLPYLQQFSPVRAEDALRGLANAAPCLTLSSVQPESLAPLVDWLSSERNKVRSE